MGVGRSKLSFYPYIKAEGGGGGGGEGIAMLNGGITSSEVVFTQGLKPIFH